jgi:hypothetical protein
MKVSRRRASSNRARKNWKHDLIYHNRRLIWPKNFQTFCREENKGLLCVAKTSHIQGAVRGHNYVARKGIRVMYVIASMRNLDSTSVEYCFKFENDVIFM